MFRPAFRKYDWLSPVIQTEKSAINTPQLSIGARAGYIKLPFKLIAGKAKLNRFS